MIIILLLGIITLILFSLKESRISKINKSINGPRLLPLIGNLFDLSKKDRDIHETFDYFYKLYGPIYRVKLGNIETIVLSDNLLKEAFTGENSELFKGRFLRKSRAKNTKCLNIGNSNGDYYKKLFSIMSPELTSTKLKKYIEPHVKSELIEFCKFIDGSISENGEEFEISNVNQFIRLFTLNCILRSLFSVNYPYSSINDLFGNDNGTGAGDGNGDNVFIIKLVKAIENYVTNSGKVVLGDFIPLFYYFLKDKPKSYYSSYNELKSYASLFVEKSMKNIKKQGTKDLNKIEPKNISELLLVQVLKGNIEYEAVLANCIDLILGGTDTTSNTICFSIVAILNNQLQNELFSKIINGEKQCEKEQDEEIDEIKVLLYSDYKSKIPYLQSIVKETFRRYPPVPIGLQHILSEDCIIGDHLIAAGTQIFQNIYSTHLSESVWDEPLKFDPNRFENDINNNNSKLLYQYGIGSRRCIGFNVSDSEIFTFLATVFKRYQFVNPNPNSPLNDKGKFSLAMQCPPLKLILKKKTIITTV